VLKTRSGPSRRRFRSASLVVVLVMAALASAMVPAQAAYYDPDDSLNFQSRPEDFTAGKLPKARVPGRLAPATGALLGVHGDSDDDLPKEDQKIWQLEQKLGRTLDIDNHYIGDFDYFLTHDTMPSLVYYDLEEDRIPLVGWACGDSDDIVAGRKDASIDAAADAMKAYPREFFMRYCWEMDGRRQSNPKTPEKFIAAWRRIHDRFKAKGVTNVIWVWCANASNFHTKDSRFGENRPAAPLYYPGDDYVDWVSSDGYNWGDAEGRDGSDDYRYFVEIYNSFMSWARSTDGDYEVQGGEVWSAPNKAAHKPIMVGEYGTQETPNDSNGKANWFRVAHQTVMDLPTTPECPWCGLYSDIAAMVYFDVKGKSGNDAGGWAIDTTTQALAAYKEASDHPWFKQIQTLTWGPYTGTPVQQPPVQEPPVQQPPVQQPGENPSVDPKLDGGRSGYWMLGADGKVYPFGEAKAHGNAPIPPGAGAPFMVSAADVEPTPSGNGYWIVDSAGAVYGYGDAGYFGGVSATGLAAGEKVTSLSATPTGKGYWIFTTKGRAITFGDAGHFGDMAKVVLNGPVLDSIPTPSGKGYYMVASDGGIFAFGDARFFGSMGGKPLNAPVPSLVPDPDGTGYWLVASDGGIFAFEALFRGSMGGKPLNRPVTGMVPYGNGYLMVGEDGGIFAFSDKPFAGSLGNNPPAHPIVSVAALD
jgi:hypothetical protein